MVSRIGFILCLLFAPLITQAQPKEQWVEHRPAGAGYRIEFPRAPTLTSRDIQTAAGVSKMHIAMMESGPTIAFVALHNEFPAGAVGEPQAALDRGRDNALAAGKRVLIEERRTKVGDAPARRLVVEEPDKQLVLTALIVVRGDNLYQAIYVTTKGQNTADGERFLSSFALLPR